MVNKSWPQSAAGVYALWRYVSTKLSTNEDSNRHLNHRNSAWIAFRMLFLSRRCSLWIALSLASSLASSINRISIHSCRCFPDHLRRCGGYAASNCFHLELSTKLPTKLSTVLFLLFRFHQRHSALVAHSRELFSAHVFVASFVDFHFSIHNSLLRLMEATVE